MIHTAQPSPAFINRDPQLTDAFWYWHGASGRRYIHSVYPADACPVMPGAVYISVRETTDQRFVPIAITVSDAVAHLKGTVRAAQGATEVHVHLLARDGNQALRIRDDLSAGLFVDAGARDALRDACSTPAQRDLLSEPAALAAV